MAVKTKREKRLKPGDVIAGFVCPSKLHFEGRAIICKVEGKEYYVAHLQNVCCTSQIQRLKIGQRKKLKEK